MVSAEQQQIHQQAAVLLDAIAAEPAFDCWLLSQLEELVERGDSDGLLWHAWEEVNHYSGLFNARNLFLIRVKPDSSQISEYKAEFAQIAEALRGGMTWNEYKQVNHVCESGDLSRAIKLRWIRLRRALRRP